MTHLYPDTFMLVFMQLQNYKSFHIWYIEKKCAFGGAFQLI